MKNDTPFLTGYRTLKIPIVDSSGAPAWPELFPLSAIENLRQTVGARHFSAQMMLDFIPPERARLAPDALQIYSGEIDWRTAKLQCSKFNDQSSNNREQPIEHCTLNFEHLITGISAYWDPSSARHGADSSVCVLILRDDKTRRAFIHDVRYLRVADSDAHPMASQCGLVLDFMNEYNLRHIAIEVNGIGNAMPEILRDCAMRRAQPLVVQKIVNSENKERRILNAIEPLLSTGRLFMHERVRTTPLVDEMNDWTPVATVNHDDGIDAVAGALRTQSVPLRPRGQMVRPISARTEFKV